MDTINEKLRRDKISKSMKRCGLLWERYKSLVKLQHPLADDFKISSYAAFRAHFARWQKYGDEPMTELLIQLENPSLIFRRK